MRRDASNDASPARCPGERFPGRQRSFGRATGRAQPIDATTQLEERCISTSSSPETVVGRYRILRPLGAGGMGEVYLAVDETLGRKVALKAIRAEQRLDAPSMARFRREARLLSQLDHPHICQVHDYVEADDGDYIVLELIEGQDLADTLTQGLDRARALEVAEKVLAGLSVAHAQGIVHRDLKPANIQLGTNGDIKILDFGLARSEQRAASNEQPTVETRPADDIEPLISQPGTTVGTLYYMSPEQALGKPPTPASDMYSFGLILQEILTGQRAFPANIPTGELVTLVLEANSNPPTGLPADLTTLIEALKAPSASERPTAVETAQRLRWILERPKRRIRRLAIAAGLLAAVAGATKYTLDVTRERAAAVEGWGQA